MRFAIADGFFADHDLTAPAVSPPIMYRLKASRCLRSGCPTISANLELRAKAA